MTGLHKGKVSRGQRNPRKRYEQRCEQRDGPPLSRRWRWSMLGCRLAAIALGIRHLAPSSSSLKRQPKLCLQCQNPSKLKSKVDQPESHRACTRPIWQKLDSGTLSAHQPFLPAIFGQWSKKLPGIKSARTFNLAGLQVMVNGNLQWC